MAAKVLDKDERIEELTRQRAKARKRAREKEDEAKLSRGRLKRAKACPLSISTPCTPWTLTIRARGPM